LDHVLPISVAILVANWVANAIEPGSIYELIIHKNNFPFLDNRQSQAFDSSLADLVTVTGKNEMIDVEQSSYVSSTKLRSMLELLQTRGEFDGCIPIIKDQLLVGLISAPELEFALDKVRERCNMTGHNEPVMCRLSVQDAVKYHQYYSGSTNSANRDYFHRDYFDRDEYGSEHDNDCVYNNDRVLQKVCDLTPYLDVVPITMDIHSPLALVQMIFTRLGTRVVCVVKRGRFVGILHRKKYIEFCQHEKH
jgi:chloride channel 3/4/5